MKESSANWFYQFNNEAEATQGVIPPHFWDII